MLTAIAIDDEPHALTVIEAHASKVPFLELKTSFTNAFEAVQYLQHHEVDLIFLDIQMPDISGIDFLDCLQKVPMVIFTTAYSEYAVQGFELNAVDYLLKPFSLARLLKACNKALDLKKMRVGEKRDFIFVKTGYEDEKVLFDELMYVEAEGNYLTLHLQNRKLLCRQTLSEMLQLLPAEKFVRVHRSYIVALNSIEKIAKHDLFIRGREIPIGASFEDKLTEIRTKFLGN